MQEGVIWEVLVVQVIMIVSLFGIIIFLLKTSKSIKYEKRIASFALSSIKDTEKSYFDIIYNFFWQIIRRISKILSKSVVLKRYGEKFDKYIIYEEREFKAGIDYVSLKFVLGILLVIFNILTITFQYVEFNYISFLVTFLLGFFLPDIFLNLEFLKKRKQVEEDLLKAIIIMNNAFKSGRNIMQAIDIVKTELEGPIADEFKKIYLDITYGLSLEVVFGRFYQRVKLEDAKYITSSLTMLNKTGGNIVKVFSSIEKSFFDKKKLRNELKSMTASSMFVFRVLEALPFIFAIFIFILNPSYFAPLFKTSIGWLLLILIIFLYCLYVIIIKKTLKVEI